MDNRRTNVRKQVTNARCIIPDRRVVRTRQALGNALVELMLDRRFEEITVQQVLARAKVGRSTFYAHYRNMPDLLLTSAERYLGMLEAQFLDGDVAAGRVAPVAELFAHVADMGPWLGSLQRSGMSESVFGLVTGHLARLIERRIGLLAPTVGSRGLSRGAVSRLFAAALVELMRWWLDHGTRPGASVMDARFHEIVWGAMERIGDAGMPADGGVPVALPGS